MGNGSECKGGGVGADGGDCTVLVCSCDKYSDLHGPFIALFRKFWPDCPFEVVLVTETIAGYGFDRNILAGSGGNWASRLSFALGGIRTPYILMLCDDYLLSGDVDTSLILRRLTEAKELGAANLRMIPNPKPTPANSSPATHGLLEYRKCSAYSIATQAGFWERGFLSALAAGKCSIWEFERLGSFEVGDETRPLLVTPTQEFPFIDAVHKGYWEKAGLALCRTNGVAVDLARRGLPPMRVRAIEAFKRLVFAIFPWNAIVRLQNKFGIGAKEKRK